MSATFGGEVPDGATLIGCGAEMLWAARQFREQGLTPAVVLAPRHENEIIAGTGLPAAQAFRDLGCDVHVLQNINHVPDPAAQPWAGIATLALCFGPAWVFSPSVCAAFGLGMVNFNATPVPRYIGGAHFTWQIMNGYRRGSCVLQEITADVDRGPILRRHDFELPSAARIPEDYYDAYDRESRDFLTEVIRDFCAGASFEAVPFSEVERQRAYFPRLFTPRNGFIDWSWSAPEIERFCCAFDRPYPGAATYLQGRLLRLRGVCLVEDDIGLSHPFMAGLVVRRLGEGLWLAARDGLLSVAEARWEDGDDARAALQEGMRLVTPPDALHAAFAYLPRYGAAGLIDKKSDAAK